jgi:hypothetical protein
MHGPTLEGAAMDDDRFAKLQREMNREFGRKERWQSFFHRFQGWLEESIEKGVEKLSSLPPGKQTA